MKFKLLLLLYNAITFALLMIMHVYAMITNNKVIKLKLLYRQPTLKYKKSIWIHCASLGESISVYSLVKTLHEQCKDINFVITTNTLTGFTYISQNLKNIAIPVYCPYDNHYLINKFIKHINPLLAIWIDQEFLPATLSTLNNAKVPIYLLNARMSDKSFTTWKKLSFIIKNILSLFTKIYTTSTNDQNKYMQLTDQTIYYIGNLKDTNTNLPANNDLLKILIPICENKIVFVAISTHQDEEEQIFEAHNLAKEKINNLVTFIIPRHPQRTTQVQQSINSKFHISLPILQKESLSFDKESSCILVSSSGNIPTFLKIAKIAFIGKSLSPQKGGHNIMEPIYASVPVICGSNMDNFTDITNQLINLNIASMVKNKEELANSIVKITNNYEYYKNNIKNYLKNNYKLLDNFIKIIMHALLKQSKE